MIACFVWSFLWLVVCLGYLVRSICFVLVHLWCFDSVFSVTAYLLLYLDTVGFAYYRYVFVVRCSYPSQAIDKYFRSWRRRRLSSFFSFDAVLKSR